MTYVDKDKLVSGQAYKIYFRDCCIEGYLNVPAVFQCYRIAKDYTGHDEPAEYYTAFPKDRGYEIYDYDLIFDIGEFDTHNAMYFEELADES